MPSELFPPGFPSELAVAAFRAGDEAAWPSVLAAAAVEWFSRHGFAVLGTELWVLGAGLPLRKFARDKAVTIRRRTQRGEDGEAASD
jgi:hypothetical protein